MLVSCQSFQFPFTSALWIVEDLELLVAEHVRHALEGIAHVLVERRGVVVQIDEHQPETAGGPYRPQAGVLLAHAAVGVAFRRRDADALAAGVVRQR